MMHAAKVHAGRRFYTRHLTVCSLCTTAACLGRRMERDIFHMKKQSAVLGTCEPAAFILSLRDGNEFCKTHSSGYHCIPHIGVYGENYSVCSPIALISLPPTPSCLQRLPLDLHGALDLVPLCDQTSRLAQTVQTNPCRRAGIGGVQGTRTGAFNYSAKEEAGGAKNEEEEGLLNEPSSRHLLNPTWAVGTFDTVKEEEEEEKGEEPKKSVDYEPSYGPISIVVQGVDREDPSQMLRSLAKKIVMKALHTACKVLNASNRRGSIDYLIANTKRLKVGRSPSPLKETRGESPSPVPMENHEGPLPLHPRRIEGTRLDASCACDDGPDAGDMHSEVRSVSPPADCRRKRSRSHSQDSNAMQELNVFRFQKGVMSLRDVTLQGQGGEEGEGQEEELPFSVLDDISMNCVSGAQCDLQARGLEFGLGTNANGPQLSLGTVINSLQEMSLASRHVGGGTTGAMHRGNARDHLNLCGEWSTAAVPGIDLFVVIHTYPPPSVCQKFLCYKDNEVNLMYHFWLFPDAPLDGGCVRQEVLEMGVFQPLGVTPVHQNLRDGGVAFHYMEHRTVCIHNGAFSPENAQLELVRGNHLHVFFSAARSSNNNNRRVIAYHVVPGNIDVEQRLRDTVGRCTTLSELVEGLSSDFPEPGATIHTLINSLQR